MTEAQRERQELLDTLIELRRENVRLLRQLEQDYVDRQPDLYQEVRLNDDGWSVDEFVANHVNCHFEFMSSTSLWIGITRGGAEMAHLDISSKAKIRLTVRNEGLLPGQPEDIGWPRKRAALAATGEGGE